MRLVLAAVACALAFAASARADGDPASDVLIKARVFEPYYVKLPAKSTAALARTIATARAAGYPVRVALIEHDYDLGSAGLLYRRPQIYAKFLAQELANFNRDWLLVVMPNGYGIYHCLPVPGVGPCEKALATGKDAALLRSLPAPERSRKDLAAAGDTAVVKLAALHGANVGGSSALKFVLIAAVLAALAGGALLAVRRHRATSPSA